MFLPSPPITPFNDFSMIMTWIFIIMVEYLDKIVWMITQAMEDVWDTDK